MFPYHHDPEGDAALNAELRRIFHHTAFPFKRLWAWLRSAMPTPNENGVFVPPMGYGGIGGYYPALHEHESCGCGELSQRDRWDMPIARENVVTGAQITPELQALFGFFGTVTGIINANGDSIDVTYDGEFTITFYALTGAPKYEGL
jgi:hypothetical protein